MTRKQNIIASVVRFAQTHEKADCVDSFNNLTRKLADAGFEFYTENNCVAYMIRKVFPDCTMVILDGLDSSKRKGLDFQIFYFGI